MKTNACEFLIGFICTIACMPAAACLALVAVRLNLLCAKLFMAFAF
jgi:hypothetical protein